MAELDSPYWACCAPRVGERLLADGFSRDQAMQA